MAEARPTMKVTLIDDKGKEKQVHVVNRTHKKLLAELRKPEEERDISYIRSQNEFEPYFDPNIHEPVTADDKKEEATATAKKTRVPVPVKPGTPAPAKTDVADDDED